MLNRLADRALVSRARRGRTMVYTAKLNEAQYLSRSLERTLAGASLEARQVALTERIGGLDAGELERLSDQARRAQASRESDG